MNETLTTIRGTVITDPTSRRVGNDPVFSFRVASNSRYLDKETNQWRTGGTLYLGASCWGRLAEKAAGRIVKGDGVIMQGRLVTNEYERDGVACRDLEMRVMALGPDLMRMDVSVRRPRVLAEASTSGAGVGVAVDSESESTIESECREDAGSEQSVGNLSGSGERQPVAVGIARGLGVEKESVPF